MVPAFRLTRIALLVAGAALTAPPVALAHGNEVPTSQLRSAWEAPPAILVPAGLALLFFVQAFVRLRRRGRPDLAPWTRALLFAAGLVLLVLPLVSPLDPTGDDYLLSAHMLQHVLIGDVAAALLVLAVRGPLLFFLLPPPMLRRLAACGPLRTLLSLLLRPLVSLGLWAVTIMLWHVPSAYDYTLTHPLVHDLEHLSFFVTGLLVWTQLVDPGRHERLKRPQRILFALAMLLLTQPLVDALAFSSSPGYPSYARQPVRLWGISPVTDQRLAGTVMMFEQLLLLGLCVAILLGPYLRRAGMTVRGTALPHGSR